MIQYIENYDFALLIKEIGQSGAKLDCFWRARRRIPKSLIYRYYGSFVPSARTKKLNVPPNNL